MVLMCLMVLSFLIIFIRDNGMELICLIDLCWEICNDLYEFAFGELKHSYYMCQQCALNIAVKER